MKRVQLVIGPAGSGKSTYCAALQVHCQSIGQSVYIVNLDPAAEKFSYDPLVDVRDLISVSDVQDDAELKLGPNGSLVFCMEYLLKNLDWLREGLNAGDDDYFIFDCPGQIELYSHLPIMERIISELRNWGFYICVVFLLDTHFMLDSHKFIGGALCALSAMTSFEAPAVNVLSKVDLLTPENKELLEDFLQADIRAVIENDETTCWSDRYRELTSFLGSVIDDYSLLKFVPLDIKDEESISDLLMIVNQNLMYGEDAEVRDRYPDLEDLNGISQDGLL